MTPGWQLLTATGELLHPGARVRCLAQGPPLKGTVTTVGVAVKWDTGVTERCLPDELEVVED